MRKGPMMVALVALLVALFATAAYAATIEGNDRNNNLFETAGDDRMLGKGGADVLDANNYTDDIDRLRGGSGNDRLLANDGDTLDSLRGGPGFDTCVVDARSEVDGGCNQVRVRSSAI
jgi:Ca2+-binding RTX toxin-like protein